MLQPAVFKITLPAGPGVVPARPNHFHLWPLSTGINITNDFTKFFSKCWPRCFAMGEKEEFRSLGLGARCIHMGWDCKLDLDLPIDSSAKASNVYERIFIYSILPHRRDLLELEIDPSAKDRWNYMWQKFRRVSFMLNSYVLLYFLFVKLFLLKLYFSIVMK